MSIVKDFKNQTHKAGERWKFKLENKKQSTQDTYQSFPGSISSSTSKFS